MLICLFVCLFMCFLFESSWETHKKLPWKFREDPTWFGWDIQDLKHVYLFVCLLTCLFLFELFWNTHRNIPWKFREDRTCFGWDIKNLKNVYLFVCLFVCLLICFFVLIILGHPQEVTLNILWRSNLILLKYLGYVPLGVPRWF